MSFVNVYLEDWETSKVKIGLAPKGNKPTILYEDKDKIHKMPILSVRGNKEQRYVLESYSGLQKNMIYDSAQETYTDKWAGDWSISFKICTCIKNATPLEKKLMQIFADITEKATIAFDEKPAKCISYTMITQKNDSGITKEIGIDDSKGAYIKVKVNYDAPQKAETFMQGSTAVPVFEARYPKAKFYDASRQVGKYLVEKPDPESACGMKATPEFLIGAFKTKDGKLYITKKLMKCYYMPHDYGSNECDDELIDALREQYEL